MPAYKRKVGLHPQADKVSVQGKTCLSTHIRSFHIRACGHYTCRLKHAIWRSPSGNSQVLSAQMVFDNYPFNFALPR